MGRKKRFFKNMNRFDPSTYIYKKPLCLMSIKHENNIYKRLSYSNEVFS